MKYFLFIISILLIGGSISATLGESMGQQTNPEDCEFANHSFNPNGVTSRNAYDPCLSEPALANMPLCESYKSSNIERKKSDSRATY